MTFIVTTVISLVPHNNSELLALVFLITSGLALWNFIRVGRNASDSSVKTQPRSRKL